MKASQLRVIEGIDALHIDIEVNLADVHLFCLENNLKFEEHERTKWQRKWFIFLHGEPISVIYHQATRNTTFEVGGLFDYNMDLREYKKLDFLHVLIWYFSDRTWKISRFDYAIDINLKWDEMLPDMRATHCGFSASTIYFNRLTDGKKRKKLSTLIIYDKARDIGLFSTDLTRIELRLYRPCISRLKLTDMFDSRDSFMRASNLIYSVIENQLSLYSVDGSFTYQIKTDVVATLQRFLTFLHGDESTIHRADPFRIYFGLALSDKIISWMIREGISPAEVKKHIRGKKVALCKSLCIDTKTFDKAVSFFRAI